MLQVPYNIPRRLRIGPWKELTQLRGRDEALARKLFRLPDHQARALAGMGYVYADRTPYIHRGFPEAIRDIANKSSTIRCNFDVGGLWDVEAMINERIDWTAEEWETRPRAWNEEWDTACVPPLPTFVELLAENGWEFDD